MSRAIAELELLLRANRWRHANEQTRLLLAKNDLNHVLVTEINDCWTNSSNGKFGFRTQCRRWVALGGLAFVSGFTLWGFMPKFGDDVGWRRDRMWLSWAHAFDDPPTPVLDPISIPLQVPVGCLPFHDIMSGGRWRGEFLPRDCWGEHVWDRWARLLNLFT